MSKKIIACLVAVFAMCALQSQAYLSLNFAQGGGSIGSTSVVTLSNLVGGVTVSSSTSGTPALTSSNVTAYGVTGTIGLNFLAVDDSSSAFNPATWTGGGQSAGNSIKADAPGWGVRYDDRINGAIQSGEALLMTFDFSDLNLDANEKVELSKVVLAANLGGDVWIKPAGASTGTRLLENGLVYSGTLEVKDGDQLAFMRNSKDVYLNTLEFDVIPEPASLGMIAVGAGMLLILRRRFC